MSELIQILQPIMDQTESNALIVDGLTTKQARYC